MADYGLVSIITPSYNSAGFIAETINSILSQTYTNWELLITDDCSSDESCQVIRSYAAKDARIQLFLLNENSGAGVARNNSIKNARGRFLAFCDSDDRWYPGKLENQLSFMINNGYEFTYSSYDTCDEGGNVIGYVNCLKRLSYITLIRDNGIGCLTCIYDTHKIGKVFMPTMRKRQDWGLWLSIIKRTGKAYGLQERLALYRVRKNSISSNKIEMLKYNFQLYHKVEGIPSFLSILLIICYFLPYYFYKKLLQKKNSLSLNKQQ